MKTYYVDPLFGNDNYSGLDILQPIKSYQCLHLLPGDTVLFKRGSIIRGELHASDGSEKGYITYGAYGTGRNPAFLGSVPLNDPDEWHEELPSVWKFHTPFSSEVCNLIFNDGRSFGIMRWQPEDLKDQGEWYFTQLGQSSEADRAELTHEWADGELYVYSSKNPSLFYNSIECVLWGNRKLADGKQYIIFENLVFKNAGVHGYQESRAHHIIIRNCEFRFIGGGVWSREIKLRFGNAVEFWDGAEDVYVEKCVFTDVYDSGVTHQGSDGSGPYERIFFRNNLFISNGMAAYECRGPAAGEVYFENNTCINAGFGFSMQGEDPPRQADKNPPTANHVLIWLIGKGSQKGKVYIRDNVFYEAPYGAVIYSMIEPEDEKYYVIDKNFYCQSEGNLLMHFGGKDYSADRFGSFKTDTGNDEHSILTDR